MRVHPVCYGQRYGLLEKCPTCEFRCGCVRKQEEEREKQRRVCEGSCLISDLKSTYGWGG